MRKFIFAVIVIVIFGAVSAQAKDVFLSMVYTNALGEDLPFSIFSKQNWSPDAKARFVKLHLYFDEPIMVSGLEINSCGSSIDSELSVFFNFDQWVLQTDPNLVSDIPDALYPEKRGDLLVVEGFEDPIEVRSLTLNFEFNSGFKVCGINLKDPKGQRYTIKTPEMVVGKVEASSILDPQSAYDPIFLFDSRFEYGWASNKQAKNVNLTFNFDQPKRIEKIRIWNGYQRSVAHCLSNSRVKKIRVTGDGNYAAEVSVKDTLGSQLIELSKPFEGKQLKFEIVDSFLGRSYQDLVISEIRFFDGREWFMLDPSSKLKRGITTNRAQFAKAKVDALLNDSYTAEAYTDQLELKSELENEQSRITSKLRLRADGSFYLSGDIGGDEEDSEYFALGNYEIKEADEKGGLKIRIFGLYYESVVYGDCNGCGRDCNKNQPSSDSFEDEAKQKIFQEFITIKPSKDGKFVVLNENGGKKIKFKKLEFVRESKGL